MAGIGSCLCCGGEKCFLQVQAVGFFGGHPGFVDNTAFDNNYLLTTENYHEYGVTIDGNKFDYRKIVKAQYSKYLPIYTPDNNPIVTIEGNNLDGSPYLSLGEEILSYTGSVDRGFPFTDSYYYNPPYYNYIQYNNNVASLKLQFPVAPPGFNSLTVEYTMTLLLNSAYTYDQFYKDTYDLYKSHNESEFISKGDIIIGSNSLKSKKILVLRYDKDKNITSDFDHGLYSSPHLYSEYSLKVHDEIMPLFAYSGPFSYPPPQARFWGGDILNTISTYFSIWPNSPLDQPGNPCNICASIPEPHDTIWCRFENDKLYRYNKKLVDWATGIETNAPCTSNTSHNAQWLVFTTGMSETPVKSGHYEWASYESC